MDDVHVIIVLDWSFALPSAKSIPSPLLAENRYIVDNSKVIDESLLA